MWGGEHLAMLCVVHAQVFPREDAAAAKSKNHSGARATLSTDASLPMESESLELQYSTEDEAVFLFALVILSLLSYPLRELVLTNVETLQSSSQEWQQPQLMSDVEECNSILGCERAFAGRGVVIESVQRGGHVSRSGMLKLSLDVSIIDWKMRRSLGLNDEDITVVIEFSPMYLEADSVSEH